MSLISGSFWLAFLVLLPLYYLCGVRGQNRLLVMANVAFVLSWGWRFTLIHFALAGTAFFGARWMAGYPAARRRILVGCLGIFLGALLYLKWTAPGFTLFSSGVAGIGLSFNACQLLGYLLEVYWHRIAPERNPARFVLFSSFFALVSSGPIERFKNLRPQFDSRRSFDDHRVTKGLYLIALGCFKKFAIANPLLRYFDPEHWHGHDIYGWGFAVYCVLGFFELYADFSGYIDIARGLAQFLGIDLAENFAQPYFPTSITDIWRRWNITLIAWMTDFVYMPILISTRNIYLAATATILLVGFWHGLTFNYLLWTSYWILLYAFVLVWRPVVTRPWLGRIVTYLAAGPCLLAFIGRTPADFADLPLRMVRLTAASTTSFLANDQVAAGSLLLVAAATTLMIGVETLSLRPKRWMFALGAGLVFLTATLGDFTSRAFVYMRF